ncbi:hypothetical protein [Brachybacterium kimchii]|uniref:Uncharacterized protein n=1 Tax=Brachybacterium kimchii TaxID=2942909 RepID=A0ABY4N7Y8_9MICO|nr:hypothetical protein [Brachybacterium kimchii]UQN30672.1 hypothetical protein M4486_05045 [Brachybacterium kimchii]
MRARVDVELSVKDLDPGEAVEVWNRMSLVATGFLLDDHEVEVTTYRYTDDDGDDIEVLAGPPSDEADS